MQEDTSKGEIIIYKTPDKKVEVRVALEKETIWATLNQIADLFETDKSGISRHIKNIYKSGELSQKATVAKIATVQKEGKREIRRNIEYYNLDIILSVGYRVSSQKATQFRIWATNTLRGYLVKGYAINEQRFLDAKEKFTEIQEAISFLKEKSRHESLSGQGNEILNLLADYSKTLTLLEEYDTGKLKTPSGKKAAFVLDYESVKKIISELKKELSARKEAGDLFGQEYDRKLESIIKNLYQTFDGKELYKTTEEKSANLLYLVIKDHPLADGNKRTASFLFVYFLDKNNVLHKETGEKKINDNALTALALLVALNDPKDKEIMIKIIVNLLRV